MSRVKEFDVDEACDAALALFRRQGYEATSVSDLVAHLGVAKASLYATFGTKHDLYVATLKRYAERTDAQVVASLSRPGSGVAAVRGLLEGYVADIAGDAGPIGCFVVNAAIELLPRDPAVARLVERSWDTLEVALTMTLERAKAQDELPEGSDPATLARFLLTVLQGLRVLGKGADAAGRLDAAVSQAMRVLVRD
ncbi:TetR/AcrR family transcriptional regulator [Amycolatopsis sp. NBC_01286]|uniref:TetR/AcrR family transcriptional regulator n=1 Tax=Amycolatopsis sp. NBC_01286 TaxID=2903560 RepID=UPI002E14BB5A|nr:TetR/AcrR family transcriptional regulator [Amycolatopsis sp. NBC_01286]